MADSKDFKSNKYDNLSDEKYVSGLSQTQLESIINELNDAYYNSTSLIPDNVYDNLIDIITEKFPNSKVLKQVGSSEKKKVKLPVYMGSMTKIKPEGLVTWFKSRSNKVVITDKIDGKSVLIQTAPLKLYSRGNGTEGQDITYIVEYLNNESIDILKKVQEKLMFRGELVISKESFNDIKKNIKRDDDKDYSTARNLVSGITNFTHNPRKELLKKVEIVFYQYYSFSSNSSDSKDSINSDSPNSDSPNSKTQLKQSEQLKKMKDLGLKVVNYSKETLNDIEKELDDILTARRKESIYDIDGIVVSVNQEHELTKDENPKHSFAYKKNSDNAHVAKVVDVLWDVSKDCFLKPKIEISPVVISGSKITYATAFNAKYVQDNKLCKGSEILITKGGDVIPHIVSVKTKDTDIAKMPDCKYDWTENSVDIFCDKDDPVYKDRIQIKLVTHFFETLEIKKLTEKMVTRLYDKWKKEYSIDTVKKIIKVCLSDKAIQKLQDIDGIGEKGAETIVKNVKKGIKDVDIVKLADASFVFGRGFGEKKIQIIKTGIPDIFTEDFELESKQGRKVLRERLTELKGIEDKTARKFVDKLSEFKEYVDSICEYITLKDGNKEEKGNKYANKKFVFSGVRDSDLQAYIEQQGGKVTTCCSKGTVVICKDPNKLTGKLLKAKEMGNEIVEYSVFKKQAK